MERNYQKEYALAMKKILELQELVFAYQSAYDDALAKLNEDTDSNSLVNNENTELVEEK